MYAQYKINTENPPKLEGISWKTLRGKSVSQRFEIEQINEFTKNNPTIRDNNIITTLLGYETGGAWTNTGSSTIICGPQGEPLKAVELSKSCNSTHALFIRKDFLSEIKTNYWNKANYKFSTKISIYFIENNNIIKSRVLGSLEFNLDCLNETLPTSLDNYKEAIEASVKKATCYHCRSIFYSL